MKLTTFVNRLNQGKANNLIYAMDGKEGLVSVWQNEGLLVLTWEECPAGQQYDEATYTRDEHYNFATMDELLEFLAVHDLSPESFTP
jgi:hypothetical protein